MASLLSRRDYVRIRQAARLLGVTEATLQEWDRSGRLPARRDPANGSLIYRVEDLHALIRGHRSSAPDARPAVQMGLPLNGSGEHWQLSVALDPKHRPQRWTAPSSTVRRDWRKFPQEAHVLDESEVRYRRLTVEEIALFQGFEPTVVSNTSFTTRQLIASLGDAVPPPLAVALARAINASHHWKSRTSLEICAGIGGLAEGAASIGLTHLALIDHSDVCGQILRRNRPWMPDRVHVGDALTFDYQAFKGQVGLLSGGPPCQPWSQAGLHLGADDPRDVLGHLPEIIAQLEPEVFLIENVPGLLSGDNSRYLRHLMTRLRRPFEVGGYGVLLAVLNAADYGVPQIRRRIFILGFKDKPAAAAYKCFNEAATYATHRDPKEVDRGRAPWRTIGDVLSTRSDPGGWRHWLGETA